MLPIQESRDDGIGFGGVDAVVREIDEQPAGEEGVGAGVDEGFPAVVDFLGEGEGVVHGVLLEFADDFVELREVEAVVFVDCDAVDGARCRFFFRVG